MAARGNGIIEGMAPTGTPRGLLAATRSLMTRASVAAMTVGLVGCASTVAGVAQKAPGPANTEGVDVALLDTGSYPVVPNHPYGTAGSADGGGLFEGQRMADNVIGPWQVDATLRQPAPLETLALSGSILPTSETLPDPLPGIATAHGLIGGFVSTRRTPNDSPLRFLLNMVLRLPDPPSAAAAAGEMAAKSDRVSNVPVAGDTPRRPVSINDHPEATAWAYGRADGGVAVQSFAAHGAYVFYQLATENHDYDNEFQARESISGALTDQARAIDRFVPTDPAKLADLPVDPSGQLLARVLWAPDGKVPRGAGTWRPHAALHFEDDPVESDALFTAAGVEWVGQLLARVYQSENADGAARVAGKLADRTRSQPDVQPTATGVRGLPDARCFARTTGWATPVDPPTLQQARWHFKCLAQVDRYAFATYSGDETDAKQQLSAQWRILAGK